MLVYAQTPRHTEQCPGSIRQCCSPFSLREERELITGVKIKQSPFNKILHYAIKLNGIDRKRHCTAFFIDTDIIMTCFHCTINDKNINYIELTLPSTQKDNWIKLEKTEFNIYSYQERFSTETDIVIIKLKNKQKLKLLYKGHFEIADSNIITDKTPYTVHLTGFPCDKFSTDVTSPDTLVDRNTALASIEFNTAKTLVGHPMYSCRGESGSPLWIEINNKQYVIAVNQGRFTQLAAGFGSHADLNTAVLINEDVKRWIQSIQANTSIKKNN